MSEFLGNLAARALGLSAVARPRPSIFEPRRAAAEPVALEEETVSIPPAARATEAPRVPSRPGLTRPVEEVEPRVRRPAASTETEADAPQHHASPAEPPATPTRARAAPPPDDRPTNAEAVLIKGVAASRAAPPAEPAEMPPAGPTVTTPSPPSTRLAPEPRLAARPSLAARLTRESAEPTVRVTIGRIEVRAVRDEEPAAPRKRVKPAPRISLDDYLGRAGERAG